MSAALLGLAAGRGEPADAADADYPPGARSECRPPGEGRPPVPWWRVCTYLPHLVFHVAAACNIHIPTVRCSCPLVPPAHHK